ncbi:MAG TPA: DEAD/DEAH box helicase, partial [Alphaproteobacteria bacterium]|nr:DEAD/DEAH box helicase [Alphaproteobacteria bacterium]
MQFSDLGLSPEVLAVLKDIGYERPTPIQEKAIPIALQRRDLLGLAQTGTGKTAGFTLPMLDLLAQGRAKARMPRSLILEPTRELAAQVAESFEKYGKNQKLSMALLIGGVSFEEQNKKLDRGVDVLIATPGRLLDHFERGRVMLGGVQILVIDEADRMLDMGFIPDIERICSLLPFTRQTMLFSATMPPEITHLADKFMSAPERIEVARQSSAAETVTLGLLRTPHDPKLKRAALRALIRSRDVKNAIIFCNRKRDVDILAKSLKRHDFNAAPIHGDLDQSVRTATLDKFRSGELRFLIASDVAARGLDIPDVSHVFNFDVPFQAEDFVHRIGRTGRAGRAGEAYTLVTRADQKSLDAILHLIKKGIEEIKLEGVDPNAEGSAEESEGREGRRNRRGGRGRGRDRHERHERAPREQIATAGAATEAEGPPHERSE